VLKFLKRKVLLASKLSGLLSAVAGSPWRANRLLILGYHGVSIADEHEWNPVLYMTPEQLGYRLELLARRRCTVLPLAEAFTRLFQGDLPKRAVSITFDDGAHDFYSVAHPLLRQWGFPATVFLTTYYCQKQLPVFTTASSYILWKGRGKTLDCSGLMGAGARFRLESVVERRSAWERIQQFARQAGASAEDKDRLLEDLCDRLGVNYGDIRKRRLLHIMSPPEVRAVHAQGTDLELHTHRHRTPRDQELFRREILENRQSIATALGQAHEPRLFCYPSGDCDARFLPWLRELGILGATTCQVGLASRRCDPLLLPRVLDHSSLSLLEVDGWLSGFSSCLPMRSEGELREL